MRDVNAGLVLPKASGTGILVDERSPTFGWRDLIGTTNPKAFGVGSPTRSVYRGNVFDAAWAVNDVCDYEYHIPHDWVVGTDLYLHMHTSHTGTSISGTFEATAYYTYSKGHNQAEFPAEKTLVVSYNTIDISNFPAYRHRIDEVQMSASSETSSMFLTSSIEVDGMILMTVKLTQLPTIGGGGKLFIHFVDIHYQSSNMATKNKAPNFYS